jgi:hypothetical protein
MAVFCAFGIVEAWQLLARMPDRETGWLSSGTSSLWRMVTRDLGTEGAIAAGEEPTLPGLTTREVDRMNETLEWLQHTPERDRKLVGLALHQLARGAKRVNWRSILPRLGLKRGSDGLRMRYGRALNRICVALNAADFCAARVSIGEK